MNRYIDLAHAIGDCRAAIERHHAELRGLIPREDEIEPEHVMLAIEDRTRDIARLEATMMEYLSAHAAGRKWWCDICDTETLTPLSDDWRAIDRIGDPKLVCRECARRAEVEA